jgi:hypothetical protein
LRNWRGFRPSSFSKGTAIAEPGVARPRGLAEVRRRNAGHALKNSAFLQIFENRHSSIQKTKKRNSETWKDFPILLKENAGVFDINTSQPI